MKRRKDRAAETTDEKKTDEEKTEDEMTENKWYHGQNAARIKSKQLFVCLFVCLLAGSLRGNGSPNKRKGVTLD